MSVRVFDAYSRFASTFMQPWPFQDMVDASKMEFLITNNTDECWIAAIDRMTAFMLSVTPAARLCSRAYAGDQFKFVLYYEKLAPTALSIAPALEADVC